jgi:hypothetical protein
MAIFLTIKLPIVAFFCLIFLTCLSHLLYNKKRFRIVTLCKRHNFFKTIFRKRSFFERILHRIFNAENWRQCLWL